jgi:anti-anti-sigma regulatory factor
MLMITEQLNRNALTFKLAGALAGEWAAVLERCWCDAINASEAPRFIVDLTEVTFVDEIGKELLSLMMQQGVELIARDILMKSIVEEIAKASSIA